MPDLEKLSREELIALILQMHERIVTLEQENDMLRTQVQGKGPGNALPPFIKPNRKERREHERKERKKRTQSFHRKREEPDEEIRHAVDFCPDCGRKLENGSEHSRRQQIEIEIKVRFIDHILIKRRCGICKKSYLPKLGAAQGIVGKHRVGPKLMSLIAMFSKVSRMPQRAIQHWLAWVAGLHLSVGEINAILQAVANRGKETADEILEEVRGSPVIHADETGWRENGFNGYLWSISTPEARHYQHNGSRASAVIQEMLGEEFKGVLVSDFYCGYNWYDGPQQRCWAHLLRDLKALREAHPDNLSVAEWVEAINQCYRHGKDVAQRNLPEEQRRQWRVRLTADLLNLARPYLADKQAPQHILAKRIEQFQDELFTFVQHPDVPPDNNPAERAIRPAVIARKVSGGTRSAKGSETTCTLMTLFFTWMLRDQNPYETCMRMLTA